jgi:hypothetical protein
MYLHLLYNYTYLNPLWIRCKVRGTGLHDVDKCAPPAVRISMTVGMNWICHHKSLISHKNTIIHFHILHFHMKGNKGKIKVLKTNLNIYEIIASTKSWMLWNVHIPLVLHGTYTITILKAFKLRIIEVTIDGIITHLSYIYGRNR